MPIVFQVNIIREDLRRNKNHLYLFGDSEIRKGNAGLAGECRGEPNAVGIRVKRFPSKDPSAFWTDKEYDRCIMLIDEDFAQVYEHFRNGGVVICPVNYPGTGLAKLPRNAPKVMEYLRDRIRAMKTGRVLLPD